MAPRAKMYIVCVLAVATGILATCLRGWQPTAGPAFGVYLAASMVAAALKVRLPGLPNTISAGFLLLLAAIAQLPLAEIIIIAAVSAAVQCLWRPARKPSQIQVAFSVATLVISATVAQMASEALAAGGTNLSMVSVIAVAAFLLYTTNTLLVAGVVALVESRPLGTVWQQCHLWAFPYFICGAILLDVSAAFNAGVTWREVLLLLPLMLLVHVNYCILAGRVRLLAREEERT